MAARGARLVEPIVDVRSLRKRSHSRRERTKWGEGRIFDADGNRMTPSYAVKKGIRYRYYISAPLMQGQPEKAATLNRIPAAEIEKLIATCLRKQITPSAQEKASADRCPALTDAEMLLNYVNRVDVKEDRLNVQFAELRRDCNESAKPLDAHDSLKTLLVPWKKTPSKQPQQIIPPASPFTSEDNRPIRAETRAKLVSAIGKARLWLDELISGVADVEEIAEREKCSIRQVNRTVTLAFLAPRLVEAAVEGRLPRGIGVASLRDLPPEWSHQYQRLGLSL
jgi:site-specific DNA recombinase